MAEANFRRTFCGDPMIRYLHYCLVVVKQPNTQLAGQIRMYLR